MGRWYLGLDGSAYVNPRLASGLKLIHGSPGFLRSRHPNPLVPPHAMAQRAQDLAEEIGEKDRSIIFYDWVSYKQREALLCEADGWRNASLCAYRDTLLDPNAHF